MKRMLPPFSAVRAFEAAARHLSFKDAADELCVTQSAISHQVKALEIFLERDLFRRAANAVTLTDAGERYFDDVASILDRLDESTRRTTDRGIRGTLHVRSTPAFASRWLLKNLNGFSRCCPDVDLQVTTGIETTDFRTDDVDVLIQYGQKTADGLRVEPFLSTSRVPVCSFEMAGSILPIERPEDMLRHTILRDVVGDEWLDWFRRAGVDICDDLHGPTFEHCDLSLRAAEQGQGIALAYEALIADEIAEGRLIKLWDIKTEPRVVYSVTCPERWMHRGKISAFRKWLLNEISHPEGPVEPSAAALDAPGYVPAHPYPN